MLSNALSVIDHPGLGCAVSTYLKVDVRCMRDALYLEDTARMSAIGQDGCQMRGTSN